MPCFFLSLCFFVLQMFFCCVQYKQCCHPRWFPHQIARQQSSTGAAFCEMPRCLAMPRPLKASSKPSLSSTPISGNDLGDNSRNNLLPSVLKRPRCQRGLSVTFFKAKLSLFEERLTESRYVFAWIQFRYFLHSSVIYIISYSYSHQILEPCYTTSTVIERLYLALYHGLDADIS